MAISHLSLPENFLAPPGFILMLKAIGILFGFSAFWLQMLPLFASVLQVFLIAYIARKIIKINSLAISAAIILAGNQTLASYSLHIRPFALDGLIVLVILALSLLSLEYKEKKYFVLLSLFSAARRFYIIHLYFFKHICSTSGALQAIFFF